ncbi:site-specific DNA-methyltransferase, partial [Listeria monocytogenes]|nr:site-specific DNA-methyltransferase [Listeria monocytogenes]
YRKWINSKKDLSGGEKAYSKLDEKGNVYREVSMAAPDKPEKRSHRPLTHPLTGKQTSVPAKGWRYIDKTMDKLLQQDLVIFGSDEKTIPNQKYLLVENMMEKLPSLYYNGASGSGDITKIGFKQNIFDNPKPVDLIRQLIVSTTKKNEVILDFFAGSGTTADAVMQTNSEDGGNRKFIVATLDEETPENSEARKVGYSTIDQISRERIRRAAEKIGDTSGFRTLKVDSTGLKEDVFKTAGELDQVDLLQDIDNHSDNRSDYDLLYDVLVDGALEYNRPITIDTMNDEQIIKYDYLGELSGVVCYFGENLTDELTRQIAILKPLLAVFKESTFDKSAQKVNVMEQFRIISPDTKVKVI